MDAKRHRSLLLMFAIMALLLLAACGGGSAQPPDSIPPPIEDGPEPPLPPNPTPPPNPALGTVEGNVTFDILPTSNTDLLESWAGTPFVPGELVVGFKNEATLRAQSTTISTAGMSTRFVRALSGATKSSGLYVNTDLSDAELLQLAQELGERPDVAWAHPNYILEAKQSYPNPVYPTDPIYADPQTRSLLWHYDEIGLPFAWAVTTGDPNGTVVAVVDTGIMYRQNSPQDSHPDFFNNVLPGYDFISDWQAAEDGDGRDGDPYDVIFDDGLHGTHVAGTIAAATNNGEGIPGIDWHARILPVRVLGRGGGTIVDIMEGTLWAAGFDIVDRVPKNNTPARVINMSLGGDGGCLPEMQAAFDAIADTGSIVVVAAGNENESTAQKFPASCNNVITVGAVDARGSRAWYSNYGIEVDIMAPGGDTQVSTRTPGYPDGVLSLGYELGPQGETYLYTFKDGTSMAAPHVAGVISLMLAVNPNLNVYSARDIITSTAFWPPQGGCDVANGCGAGIIDAYEAVVAAQNYTGNPGPGPGPGPQPGPGAQAKGPMIIMAFQETAAGELVEVGSQTSAGIIEQFSFQVDPGTIMLAAWADENEDGVLNNGDYVGVYPWPVSIRAAETKTGLDIKMAPYFEGMGLATGDFSYAQLAAWLGIDLQE